MALTGAGAHPAAWRVDGAHPRDLLSARYWADLVSTAEAGLLDFVSFGDSFLLQGDSKKSGTRVDRIAGQLDSVLVASRIAPLARRIGFIPTAIVTHTEPFHLSKAIATLDYVSAGRAGVELSVSLDPHEAALFGRRDVAMFDVDAAHREAADYAEVLALLWDSWEDDAEIRDIAGGRFIDRDKLHYIDFVGDHFSVRGPSITPRPPQGHPIIAASGGDVAALRLIADVADVGFIAPPDVAAGAATVTEINRFRSAAGRSDSPQHTFVDLVVVLGDSTSHAVQRRGQLDELDGEEFTPAAPIVTGSAAGLADAIEEWTSLDGISGVRLIPATHAVDLPRISAELVPELQRRRLFRTTYAGSTLRDRLGLARPANRFATRREVSAS